MEPCCPIEPWAEGCNFVGVVLFVCDAGLKLLGCCRASLAGLVRGFSQVSAIPLDGSAQAIHPIGVFVVEKIIVGQAEVKYFTWLVKHFHAQGFAGNGLDIAEDVSNGFDDGRTEMIARRQRFAGQGGVNGLFDDVGGVADINVLAGRAVELGADDEFRVVDRSEANARNEAFVMFVAFAEEVWEAQQSDWQVVSDAIAFDHQIFARFGGFVRKAGVIAIVDPAILAFSETFVARDIKDGRLRAGLADRFDDVGGFEYVGLIGFERVIAAVTDVDNSRQVNQCGWFVGFNPGQGLLETGPSLVRHVDRFVAGGNQGALCPGAEETGNASYRNHL